MSKVSESQLQQLQISGGAAPRAALLSHSGAGESSTQAEAGSRGQPQSCSPSCRRQWFPSCLPCWHSPALSTLLLQSVRGRQGSSGPGLEQKGHFSKGWMSFLTQEDTHGKHATAWLTLDDAIKRQHMASGGQDTQPPLDGGEGLLCKNAGSLCCQSLKGSCSSQRACSSCSASLLAREPTKAVVDTPGRTGARGG